VGFIIPETGHSLPSYYFHDIANDDALQDGNILAELPYDVNRVYRIVLQFQPRGDQWKWAPDDADATDYYIRNAGSTPANADLRTSDTDTWPQFLVQGGTDPEIYISGDVSSEWNGKSSITLTKCGGVHDNADPDSIAECGVYPYDGGTLQWWDNVHDTIPQDNWQVIEFWFKLDDDWSINDVA